MRHRETYPCGVSFVSFCAKIALTETHYETVLKGAKIPLKALVLDRASQQIIVKYYT